MVYVFPFLSARERLTNEIQIGPGTIEAGVYSYKALPSEHA